MMDFMLSNVVLSPESSVEIHCQDTVKDGVKLLIRGQACCILCCHLVGANDIDD